jgi:hypothetical protein
MEVQSSCAADSIEPHPERVTAARIVGIRKKRNFVEFIGSSLLDSGL